MNIHMLLLNTWGATPPTWTALVSGTTQIPS